MSNKLSKSKWKHGGENRRFLRSASISFDVRERECFGGDGVRTWCRCWQVGWAGGSGGVEGDTFSDRKSGVEGKRVDLGGRRIITKETL